MGFERMASTVRCIINNVREDVFLHHNNAIVDMKYYYTYTGGAHGNTVFLTYNVDLKQCHKDPLR
jgi:hypothetical protein